MSQLFWTSVLAIVLGVIGSLLAAYLKERFFDERFAKFSERRNQLNLRKKRLFKAAIEYLEHNSSAVLDLRVEAVYALVSTMVVVIVLFIIAFILIIPLQILAIFLEATLSISQFVTMIFGTAVIIVMMYVIIFKISQRLFYYVQLLNELELRRTSSMWLINSVAGHSKKLAQNKLSPFVQELIIHHAEYGVDDETMDVTDLLRSKVQNEQLTIRANKEEMGDDPAKYKVKQLQVFYSYQGKRSTKTVLENELLSIP